MSYRLKRIWNESREIALVGLIVLLVIGVVVFAAGGFAGRLASE
jgi:hypothetical protein